MQKILKISISKKSKITFMEHFLDKNSIKPVHFNLVKVYINIYPKQQPYHHPMSLFSRQILSDNITRLPHSIHIHPECVHSWRNVILSNRFSRKLFLKVKTNGIMGKLLVTKKITFLAIFSCSWCKSRKREIKKKALNILMREKKNFL